MANPRLRRHGQALKIVRCRCGAVRLNRHAYRGKDPRRVGVVRVNPSQTKVLLHTRNYCERARG